MKRNAQGHPTNELEAYILTQAVDVKSKAVERIDKLSKRIFHALHLTGYARMDFRLRADGALYVLEANANPNLSADEDLAQSALSARLTYEGLLHRIIHLGERYPAAWRTVSS